jgi:chromosome segregation ATPase
MVAQGIVITSGGCGGIPVTDVSADVKEALAENLTYKNRNRDLESKLTALQHKYDCLLADYSDSERRTGMLRMALARAQERNTSLLKQVEEYMWLVEGAIERESKANTRLQKACADLQNALKELEDLRQKHSKMADELARTGINLSGLTNRLKGTLDTISRAPNRRRWSPAQLCHDLRWVLDPDHAGEKRLGNGH